MLKSENTSYKELPPLVPYEAILMKKSAAIKTKNI